MRQGGTFFTLHPVAKKISTGIWYSREIFYFWAAQNLFSYNRDRKLQTPWQNEYDSHIVLEERKKANITTILMIIINLVYFWCCLLLVSSFGWWYTVCDWLSTSYLLPLKWVQIKSLLLAGWLSGWRWGCFVRPHACSTTNGLLSFINVLYTCRWVHSYRMIVLSCT